MAVPSRRCAACDRPIAPGDPVAPGRSSYHRRCHSLLDRAWRRTPAGRASRAATYRRRAEVHPERVAARRAVRAAVHRGQLPPVTVLACVSCACQAEQYDHAWGYTPRAWLEVEPLCRGCHYDRRVERGEVRGQEPDRNHHGAADPEIVLEWRTVRAAYQRAYAARQRHRAAFREWSREQRRAERAARATRHHA